jgi:hypothetical protein
MKKASTLLERSQAYIRSHAETTPGLWIADGPVDVAGSTSQQIGRHVR